MGKKRNARSDPEESEEEVDQVVNGGDDVHDDYSDDDEDMKEAISEENDDEELPSPSPLKKKDMHLRSGRRKRRRSSGITGLTPPTTVNTRKAKRARKSTIAATKLVNAAASDGDAPINGDKKKSSVAFDDSPAFASNTAKQSNVNGKGETSIHEVADVAGNNLKSASTTSSPAIVLDPRCINYAEASSNIESNTCDEENGSSSDEEESQELDVIPPKHIVHTNGITQNDSIAVATEQAVPQNEATIVVQSTPQNEEAGEKEVADEALGETSNDTGSTSTWVSTLQRLAIFMVLVYLSLLFSLPEVIKLTQRVVPLDDSILPPPPKIINKFPEDFKKLDEARIGYTSSTQALEDYYEKLLNRFEEIEEQLQPRKLKIEERLINLDRLEELLKEVDITRNGDLKKADKGKWDQTRDLAQQLLGRTLLTTSSIVLWNVPEDIEVDCDSGLEEDEDNENDNDDSLEEVEEEALPFLSAQLLEEKESALMLRSTITAEKFIGGAVAEDRIRKWVKSRITESIDNEDVVEAIQEIEDFVQQLSKLATVTIEKDDGHSSDASDLLLSQTIERRLDVHRADTTGIYDHASLKNGAEIIYGGKRGTSKSLIDDLPVFNRILQNSKLRFYGFGPEASLTATYPPNTLGQCWSFRQTPLKEQLKDRQLFENDDNVPNDFKRGNFGTLTIRLSEPILVDSVIIEHPPIRMTDQAESAIRSFRVVGYEDELASSKAWNLGSFEYSLRENSDEHGYLQIFEAATTVFGKEIPPLKALSLAVDSNYGHDYACLYRFRVHGIQE